MKLGIDARIFKYNITGIGRYTFEVIKRLPKYIDNLEIILYVNKNIDTMGIPNTSVNPGIASISSKIPTLIWFETEFNRLHRDDNITHFWGAASILPKLSPNVKTLTTVYDLNYKVVPRSMDFVNYLYYSLLFECRLKRSNRCVAISLGTKNRLKEYLNIVADGVAYPAVSPIFYPRSNLEIQKIKTKHKIHEKYFLSVCTWEPRKNLELLINTFLKLKKDGLIKDIVLVLVGGKGWKDQNLSLLIDSIGKNTILPLGFVEDDDLPALYSGAEAFLFPSVYEGFGIPVLEARACGTVAVTTDIPELREAGGPNSIYILPTEEGIKEGILIAASLGDIIKTRTTEQTNSSSWDDAACIIADLLKH